MKNNPPSPDKILISDLCTVLNKYMSKAEVRRVYQAYIAAATAHDGQYRRSGEAYVFHPISVAMILAELELDCACIMSALLHDCIEDTALTQADIAADFGTDVAYIVEGVSKLTGLEFHSTTERQAQNFRKLFLAMGVDMRVIFIKLADRLHNMRTLTFMQRDKQLRIATETVEIHAPIARRLGLNSIRLELENLCFKTIHPHRYAVLFQHIKSQCGNQKKLIEHIEESLSERLSQEGLADAQISGRKKQPYSIYKKMKLKHLKFSQVLDMYAFRVIVENVAQCYQAFGVIHNLYKPLPGKFKDYIALPKSNGYQSIHTILFGPSKLFIEVQIRSSEMHFVSEYGIAAHWHYKSSDQKTSELASNWMNSLLDIQQNSDTSAEFLEETKIDLFPSEVFVFTPDSDIIRLPYKSTALDFAYAVHTNIGNHALCAKIDRVESSLTRALTSGQTIEIITSQSVSPQPEWLQNVITAKAKSSIRFELKSNSSEQLAQLGKQLLTNAFAYQNLDFGAIKPEQWTQCLQDLKCNSQTDFYMKIGLSELLIAVALNKLICGSNQCLIHSIRIDKTQNKAISYAHCCYPIPNDRVAGVLTVSKGLVIHRHDCPNLMHAKQKNAQWLEIDWHPDAKEEFKVLISIRVVNQRGILASIANVIAKMGINIEHLEVQEKAHVVYALNFIISVANVVQLNQAFEALESLEFVNSVVRV